MLDTIPKEILARLSELPPLPALCLDALQSSDGDQTTSVLAEKIENDLSLVVKILRIANSSFYGRSREIGTVEEAVMLLGISRVRDLLLAMCFSKILPLPKNGFNYLQFWHHSMAVAECSRQLANYSGIDQNFAFTAGLLHDIGQLIIVVFFPEAVDDALVTEKPMTVSEEKQRLGFDHAQIAGKAASHWKFPQAIQEAIEQHETPPVPDAEKSLALVVYAANLLIELSESQADIATDIPENLQPMLEKLKITSIQAATCVTNARQFADGIVAFL